MPLKGNVPKNTEKKKMFWWVGVCRKICVLLLVVKFVTGDYGSEGLSSKGLLNGTFFIAHLPIFDSNQSNCDITKKFSSRYFRIVS